MSHVEQLKLSTCNLNLNLRFLRPIAAAPPGGSGGPGPGVAHSLNFKLAEWHCRGGQPRRHGPARGSARGPGIRGRCKFSFTVALALSQ